MSLDMVTATVMGFVARPLANRHEDILKDLFAEFTHGVLGRGVAASKAILLKDPSDPPGYESQGCS